MRVVILVFLATACGPASKPAEPAKPTPAKAPAAETPRPKGHTEGADTAQILGDSKLVREAPPPAPKPLPPPLPSVYERLHDADGTVAGLTGFSTRRVRDPRRCGAFSILVKRGKKIAPTDAKIAAMFALEFPTDLDFSETKKAASLIKFNSFVEALTKTAADANTHYQAQFASADLSVKVAATARLAQLYYRAASVVARAEIPTDVRAMGGDATEAYCETIAEKAEPLLALGEQALEACRKHAPTAPAGWWAELCKAP
jgi:hypothetical protein